MLDLVYYYMPKKEGENFEPFNFAVLLGITRKFCMYTFSSGLHN